MKVKQIISEATKEIDEKFEKEKARLAKKKAREEKFPWKAVKWISDVIRNRYPSDEENCRASIEKKDKGDGNSSNSYRWESVKAKDSSMADVKFVRIDKKMQDGKFKYLKREDKYQCGSFSDREEMDIKNKEKSVSYKRSESLFSENSRKHSSVDIVKNGERRCRSISEDQDIKTVYRRYPNGKTYEDKLDKTTGKWTTRVFSQEK